MSIKEYAKSIRLMFQMVSGGIPFEHNSTYQDTVPLTNEISNKDGLFSSLKENSLFKIIPELFNNTNKIKPNVQKYDSTPVFIPRPVETYWTLRDHDLTEQDKQWLVTVHIPNRLTAMRIAAVLAKGIEKVARTVDHLSIGVHGAPNTGKSLICDTIGYRLIDGYDHRNVPKRDCMFLESEPDEAYGGKGVKAEFSIAGRIKQITFKNYDYVRAGYCRKIKEQKGIAMVSFNNGTGNIGQTTQDCNFSLLVSVQRCIDWTEDRKSRTSHKWQVYVAPELRTPRMKRILESLERFNHHNLYNQIAHFI